MPGDTNRSGKVLVLGEDTRIILPVIRSLGRRRLEVHVGWCPETEPALRSRYVRAVHAIPGYVPDGREWLEGLRRLIARESFDLVIPATEAAVFPLQAAREPFADTGTIYLLNERAFAVAFDKAQTHELAHALGIPVPRSVRLTPASVVDEAISGFRFPLFIKPCCSVDRSDVRAKQYVRRAADRSELLRHLEAMFPGSDQLQIQESVPGTGAGVELLAERGRVLYAFQHVRLHETTGFGSTYRKSTPLDPQLLEAASALLAALDYTGVGMVEFRVDAATGDWVLLELNGRFWGSLPLAVAAGADFPYFLYQMLVEGRREFPRQYRVGIRCRNLLNDLRWMWRSLRGKNGSNGATHDVPDGWEMNRIGRWQLAKDLARTAACVDRIDTFTADDPGPLLAELGQLCGLFRGRRDPVT